MILIVDGNHLAHRCKHTFDLSNNGVDVSVTYGFLRVLNSLMKKFKPTSVIVCWDGGTPAYRVGACPEYKANRHTQDDPEDYQNFLRQIRELANIALPLMGVVTIRRKYVEGDDLVYQASRLISDRVVVVTSDRDLYQCVNANTSVYNPGTEKMITPKTLVEEFGTATIQQYVDWRALQGDSSDNIPGVVGIGEKTATKLIAEFGDISGVYNAAMGRNPKGKPSDKISSAIVSFGWDKLVRNIKITALAYDRIGSRQAIIQAVECWQPARWNVAKRYLLSNAFLSLIETDFLAEVSKLVQPMLVDGLAIPLVCDNKEPVK